MSRYEQQSVVVSSLQEGDTFRVPLPGLIESILKVTYHRLREDEDGQRIGVIGFNIVEGPLRFPVIHLPEDFPVILLLPKTTYVHLSGKSWVESLTEHHGVTE